MTEWIFEGGLDAPARWVVCPECFAAVGASCTRKVLCGMKFIETYHASRVMLAGGMRK